MEECIARGVVAGNWSRRGMVLATMKGASASAIGGRYIDGRCEGIDSGSKHVSVGKRVGSSREVVTKRDGKAPERTAESSDTPHLFDAKCCPIQPAGNLVLGWLRST